MRRWLCSLLLLGTVFAQARNPQAYPDGSAGSEAAIRAVLQAQVEAWNHHDLEKFMAGYWNSPELTFFSGTTETTGWQPTLAALSAEVPGGRPVHGHAQLQRSDHRNARRRCGLRPRTLSVGHARRQTAARCLHLDFPQVSGRMAHYPRPHLRRVGPEYLPRSGQGPSLAEAKLISPPRKRRESIPRKTEPLSARPYRILLLRQLPGPNATLNAVGATQVSPALSGLGRHQPQWRVP